MTPRHLVMRFALFYLPGLAAVIVLLRAAGTDSDTAKNFLVFFVALYLAARPLKQSPPKGARSDFLRKAVIGVALCDLVAQLAWAVYLVLSTGRRELASVLPFVVVAVVAVQASVAYFQLRHQLPAARTEPESHHPLGQP
jgi:hypothetical protein